MIKECKVLLNNEMVTVVKFDDVEIQLPSIHKNDKTIFVKYEDGRYSVVEKNSTVNEKPKMMDVNEFAEKSAKPETKKRNKKTTNDLQEKQ